VWGREDGSSVSLLRPLEDINYGRSRPKRIREESDGAVPEVLNILIHELPHLPPHGLCTDVEE